MDPIQELNKVTELLNALRAQTGDTDDETMQKATEIRNRLTELVTKLEKLKAEMEADKQKK
jgi:DNA repair exonuclease SbcCD ATPase subunit